jgi:transketolase
MILKYIPYSEFYLKGDSVERLAYMHRINALYMIQRAGSGHIGTCFSSAEIMTRLYYEEMGPDDIFLSSKGHDVPLQYSILAARGIIPFGDIHTFRQPDGLPGHPDIKTPGIVTNTGSLGMGISKGKGLALAKKMKGEPGRVFVLCGDGEMAEGQNWEAFFQKLPDNLRVIIDCNGFGSDFKMKGLEIGNGVGCVESVFTKKGQGVSFMEDAGEPYPYHSGALSEEEYSLALEELLPKAGNPKVVEVEKPNSRKNENKYQTPKNIKSLGRNCGEILTLLVNRDKNIIVLDADLCIDHGLEVIRGKYPNQYIQCGIAEQDIVSTAGGLALSGFIPVVHSFAAFLTRRANEQIYNNCTEGTHIIYVGSLAGPLPSNIGHSHEAFDDIALMKTMPGMTILEPGWNDIDKALRWAIYNTDGPVYIRLAAMPEIEGMRR